MTPDASSKGDPPDLRQVAKVAALAGGSLLAGAIAAAQALRARDALRETLDRHALWPVEDNRLPRDLQKRRWWPAHESAAAPVQPGPSTSETGQPSSPLARSETPQIRDSAPSYGKPPTSQQAPIPGTDSRWSGGGNYGPPSWTAWNADLNYGNAATQGAHGGPPPPRRPDPPRPPEPRR
jgi:hypothetical protein